MAPLRWSYPDPGLWSHRLGAVPFVRLGPSIGEVEAYFEETVPMAHRIRSAWTFVMAVAPIAAIALVEAALRRWT